MNALVLTKGSETLRQLERRIKTEQELSDAVRMRKVEVMANATSSACDAGVHVPRLHVRKRDNPHKPTHIYLIYTCVGIRLCSALG